MGPGHQWWMLGAEHLTCECEQTGDVSTPFQVLKVWPSLPAVCPWRRHVIIFNHIHVGRALSCPAFESVRPRCQLPPTAFLSGCASAIQVISCLNAPLESHLYMRGFCDLISRSAPTENLVNFISFLASQRRQHLFICSYCTENKQDISDLYIIVAD